MNKTPIPMFDDERVICHVNDDSACMTLYVLNQDGVTDIVCYKEYGERDHIPYLAIYKDGRLAIRHPAIGLTLYYKE